MSVSFTLDNLKFCNKCSRSIRGPKQTAVRCQTCAKGTYCSKACLDADREEHAKICGECSRCGLRAKDLVENTGVALNVPSPKVCKACDEALHESACAEFEMGWVRGGGPIGSWERIYENYPSHEFDDPLYEFEKRENILKIREDAEPASIGLIFGLKRTLLQAPAPQTGDNPNPSIASADFKQLAQTLSDHVSSTFSKTKDQKALSLKQACLDVLKDSEWFINDTTPHFNNLKKLVEKKVDETKIVNVAQLVKERFPTPALFENVETQIAAAKQELAAKEAEIAALEAQKPDAKNQSANPKKELDKKQKDLEELDKQKSKLGSEFKQVSTTLKKLNDVWEAERSRTEKEVESLAARIAQESKRHSAMNSEEKELAALEEEVKALELSVNREYWVAKALSKLTLTHTSGYEFNECVCCADEVPLAYLVQLLPCAHQHYCMKCFAGFLRELELDSNNTIAIKETSYCHPCGQYADEVALWTKRSIDQEYLVLDKTTHRIALASDQVDTEFPGLVNGKWTMPELPLTPPF